MYTVNIRATKICRDKYYRLSFLWCLWEKDSDREKEIERLKERQKNRQPDGQSLTLKLIEEWIKMKLTISFWFDFQEWNVFMFCLDFVITFVVVFFHVGEGGEDGFGLWV